MNTYKNGIKLYIDGKKTPIGDPYILSFEGMYYLYPSTHYEETNIKCFMSENLVDWTYKGLVTDDVLTKNAYAPEVIYAYGKFYLATSPGGNGHYIFVADHPLGPFKRITENIGEMIDGTFYYENKKLYFGRANHEGITISQMNKQGECSHRMELYAPMHGWTEGPHFIQHDNIYFMTYCGNFIESAGYRVDYGYAQTLNGSYTRGINNPLVISTKDDFKALGHSMNILGPNLLDYYIAYHQLYVQENGIPTRDLCIDALQINGKLLAVNVTNYDKQKPRMPHEVYRVSNHQFLQVGNMWQSQYKTHRDFVVVFEFKGLNQRMYFGANHWIMIDNHYVTVQLNEQVHRIPINDDVYGFVHLRLMQLDHILKIYINHHYLTAINHESHGGYIAFDQTLNMRYCAYTNIEEIYTYDVPGTILMTNHMQLKEIIYDKEQTVYKIPMIIGKKYFFQLESKNNHVSLISLYGAIPNQATFRITSKRSKKVVTVEKKSTYALYSYDLSELDFEQHDKLSIELIDGQCDMVAIRVQEMFDSNIKDIGRMSLDTQRTFEEILTKFDTNNLEMTFTMKTIKHHQRFGLMYKVNNHSKHDGQTSFGYNGYFIGFRDSLLVVEKSSYGLTRLFDKPYDLQTNKQYTLNVKYKSGVIEVYIDGQFQIRTYDPWSYSTGVIGIYKDEVIDVDIKEIICN